MNEWQDIETAPKKSGKIILLSNGSGVYIGFWNGRTWDDGDFFDDLGKMTHWMPLPELPTTPKGNE